MKTRLICLLFALVLLLAACGEATESQAPISSAPTAESSEIASSTAESSAETSPEVSVETSTEVSSETSEDVTETESFMSYEIPDNYKDMYENPFTDAELVDMEVSFYTTSYSITYRYGDGSYYRMWLVKKKWGMWMLGAMEYTYANGTRVGMSSSSTDYEWVLNCGKVGGNITFRGGNHGDYSAADWNADDSTKTNDHFIDMTLYNAETGEKLNVGVNKTVKTKGLFVVIHNNIYEDEYKEENVLIAVEKMYLFNGPSVRAKSNLKMVKDVCFGFAYSCMFPVDKNYGNYIMYHNDDGTTKVLQTPTVGTSNYGNNFDTKNKASKVTLFGQKDPSCHMTVEAHNPEDMFYQSSRDAMLWDMNPTSNKLYFCAYDHTTKTTVKKGTELLYDSSWTFSHNPGFTLPEVDKQLGFSS